MDPFGPSSCSRRQFVSSLMRRFVLCDSKDIRGQRSLDFNHRLVLRVAGHVLRCAESFGEANS